MEQFDQLLTCAICLDRYRNPKLLPCQHSFCMEPCMEGLVDYVRRQVKCPECRAEHRIPYQGVQAFPTNVTLQRFLELHIDITGELPDPTSNQIMERCQVCSEKSYLALCAHCDKRVCSDCKEGHMDVLKREITRISNQVRRVIHRLEEAHALCEKNSLQLQQNSLSVVEEIDDLYRRLAKALKDRAENLKHDVEKYTSSELKLMMNLKSNMEQEISNIQSNCELVEKYIQPESTGSPWQDNELMDTKDIFLRTMEFIRNFEYEPGDYARRIRFSMAQDPNNLVITLGSFGDLHLPTTNSGQANLTSQSSSGSALMRSKSDHRLTSQFRQQEMHDEGRTSPVFGGRKFGDRAPGTRPYGEDSETGERKSRFRSRFTRHLDTSFDDTQSTEPRVRFDQPEKKEREKVLDTEDATRGPISGITRLHDSPRVIQRIQESDCPKVKSVEKSNVVVGVTQVTVPAVVPPVAPWRTNRQLSEDDDVARQKKANKEEAASTKRATSVSKRTSVEPKSPSDRTFPRTSTERSGEHETAPLTPQAPEVRPVRKLSPERFPATKGRSESSDSGSSEASSSSASSRNTEGEKVKGVASAGTVGQTQRKDSSGAAPIPATRSRILPQSKFSRQTPTAEAKESSSESSSEEESSEDEQPKKAPEKTSKMEKTDIGPLLARSANARETPTPGRERDVREGAPPREPPPRDSSSYRKRENSPPQSLAAYRRNREAASRLTSPPVRENYGSTSSSAGANRYDYGGSSGLARSRTGTSLYSPPTEEPSSSRYTSTSGLANKYLNRSRHTFEEPEPPRSYEVEKGTRLSNLRDRRARIARSKSSHDVLGGLDPEEAEGLGLDDPSEYVRTRRKSTTTQPIPGDNDSTSLSSWARYLKNKYGKGQVAQEDNPPETTRKSPRLSGLSSKYTNKKRLLFKFGARGTEPGFFTWPRGIACGPDGSIVVADSSNHRVQIFDSHGNFMKEFGSYGNGEGGEFDCLAGVAVNRLGQIIISDRYNHRIQIFDPSGRFLRTFGSQGTSDGRFNYPWGVATDALGFIYIIDKENFRVQVFQSDGTFVGKFGSFGTKNGEFSHPHYIAVTNTNKVVVSDTNNHRIQIFDVNGKFLSSFGSEGSEIGPYFKLPRGVAVDEEGFIFVADSGNSRVSIFTPQGEFLHSYGTWGSSDGEFKGIEGIAVTPTSNIILCDRELHRVQVF